MKLAAAELRMSSQRFLTGGRLIRNKETRMLRCPFQKNFGKFLPGRSPVFALVVTGRRLIAEELPRQQPSYLEDLAMKRTQWLAVLIPLTWAGSAFAQEDAARTTYKAGLAVFEKGKPFVQEIVTETEKSVRFQAAGFKVREQSTTLLRWTPLEEKEGRIFLAMQVDRLKFRAEAGTNKVEYDSSRLNNPADGINEALKEFIKSKFVFVIDAKTGSVFEVQGLSGYYKRLSDANPDHVKFKKLYNENSMKFFFEVWWGGVPTKGAENGAIWSRNSKANIEGFGGARGKHVYKLESDDGVKARVGIYHSVSYVTPRPGEKVPGVGIIKKHELNTTHSEGFLIFDKSKGRLERGETKASLKGTIEIEDRGIIKEVAQEMVLTCRMRVSYDDKLLPGIQGIGKDAPKQIVEKKWQNEIDMLLLASRDANDGRRTKALDELTNISDWIFVDLADLANPRLKWNPALVDEAFRKLERIGAPAEPALSKWIGIWKSNLQGAFIASENIARAGFVDGGVQEQIRRLSIHIALGERTLKRMRNSRP